MTRLALAAVAALGACAAQQKVGACDAPAATNGSYSLYECVSSEADPSKACCAYTTSTGCFAAICTAGCDVWLLKIDTCASPPLLPDDTEGSL